MSANNAATAARPKVQWTAEDRARHAAIREKFRDWHPSPEELIASGEAANFDLRGEYRLLRPLLEEMKRTREAAGLTLAEVSRRCGIDEPALSRLENGHNKNPTLDTLWRYTAALARRLVLTTEAIVDTRTAGVPRLKRSGKRPDSRSNGSANGGTLRPDAARGTEQIRFRLAVVEAAAAVMYCPYCRAHAPKRDQPQPGWVGSRYVPGVGVIVLLQNPGTAPTHYGACDVAVQKLLREFSADPSVESHERLMHHVFADMAGETGGPPWAKWPHPVKKLVPDREKLAWMNVVKFRTPATQVSGRKDAPVTRDAVQHGVNAHLQHELDVLNPKAVVTIGNVARSALAALCLPPTTVVGHLKFQGASTEEVLALRRQLIDAGADL